MDLAYLRAHPDHLPTFLTHQRIRETPVHGGSIAAASRLTLDDGASVFAKRWPEPAAGVTPSRPSARPAGFFEAEAAGIQWLRIDGGAPLPQVIAALPDILALEWIDEGAPSAGAARAFGAALARTHRAGAPAFGTAWPGYIGALPLDNTQAAGPWSTWFAVRRLEPYLRLSVDRGALGAADAAAVQALITDIAIYAGEADAEPPARVHGDLWPGNLLWAAAGPVYLIDPAAHGGHRESDLAQLSLFGGAPYLADMIAAYQREWPLSPGWAARLPLHQLHLLLVHTALFGSGYRDVVMSAVRATVER
ncbi:MAG TPA: fructosamine kinase family protein [Micromonosporaceae bacterium]|nr:fructosamine kinase family protein [Micromonosporaceae bacterium]